MNIGMQFIRHCFALLVILAVTPIAAWSASYDVNVTRIESNFYSISGSTTILQTKFCYEYVYGSDAVLTMTGHSGSFDGSITFGNNQRCDVMGAYSPLSLSAGSYSASLTVEELPFYSDRLQNIIVRATTSCYQYQYYTASTLVLPYGTTGSSGSGRIGTIRFPSATCDLAGIYALIDLSSTSVPPPSSSLLTVTASGSGIISGTGITCGSDCNESYAAGTTVSLTATPSTGATFTGWTGACSGTGTCVVTMDTAKTVGANFSATPSVIPQTGIWWNPSESGRGFAIETSGNNLFLGTFLYEEPATGQTARSTWYQTGGPLNGDLSFSGTLSEMSGGQTLNGNYQAATSRSQPSTVSLRCTTTTTCSLTWKGGVVSIQRFVFDNATTPMTAPEGGIWWNPAESGRGFLFEQQGNSLFGGAFMYDESGNPVWYSAAGAITGSTYQGSLTQFLGGQSLTSAYRAPASTTIGDVSVSFTDRTHAVVTSA
jgi:hypothetical protein